MSSETLMELTMEDHQKAFTEVAFLIDIFTATIDNIMGGATASVGRIAGRDTAKKFPLFLDNPSLTEAMAVIAGRMKSGFAVSLEGSGNNSTVVFDRCILRDICSLRGIEKGQAMCKLFHAYFDGVVNELLNRPVKSEITELGEQCRIRVKMQ
jgi:predicted hydrocarbon binding protein